tara:strand:+ start:4535 stop:5623 length:1089 start_codon:yes stop_codon:yes gene_type:complete
MKHITIIAGARPNFMKIAPIINEIKKRQIIGESINYSLVHTGQHYDKKMSLSFFEQLNIPEPDVNLGAGGGTQAEQTAAIMIGFEKYLLQNKTDLVLVVGDVNSTMACAITAKKMKIKVAHVEAGIRSNDYNMPEEINRIVTDSICDYFFTTTKLADKNLLMSGHKKENIFLVGNTMIDTLLNNRDRFIKPYLWKKLCLSEKEFLMMTMHRPNNVDDVEKLKMIIDEIANNSHNMKIIFPVHPRTQKLLSKIILNYENIYMIEPLSYLEFNYLVERSFGVLTDSGGITEETTVMGIPCITLRDNTERPETVIQGTNELIGTDPKNIKPALNKLFKNSWKKGSIPELWDGKTSTRIVDEILNL